MLQDRRRSHRRNISRYAKIQLGLGALPRDCLVTDVSEGGVRLHVEGYAVPDEFVLMQLAAGAPPYTCRVVWRLGFEVGAEFVTPRRWPVL